jgi:hypothetical protein
LSYNRFNDNWPTQGRVHSRLVAIERAVGRSRLDTDRRNTGILNLIEADIVIDIWDGAIAPGDVEDRFRRDFESVASSGHVHDDGSIAGRLDRLEAAAAETYRPRS